MAVHMKVNESDEYKNGLSRAFYCHNHYQKDSENATLEKFVLRTAEIFAVCKSRILYLITNKNLAWSVSIMIYQSMILN